MKLYTTGLVFHGVAKYYGNVCETMFPDEFVFNGKAVLPDEVVFNGEAGFPGEAVCYSDAVYHAIP